MPNWVNLLEAAQTKVARIHTPSARGGTAFCAFRSSLLVTSHEAVGYETEVTVEPLAGEEAEGRVVHVDIRRGIAFIHIPKGTPFAPIPPAPGASKLADATMLVATSSRGPAMTATQVVAMDPASSTLELAPNPGSDFCGAPVFDTEGRLVGLWTRPGATREQRVSWRAATTATLTNVYKAAPLGELQINDAKPAYQCISCGEEFMPRDERCAACGVALPHAAPVYPPPTAPPVRDAARYAMSLRIAREVLTGLGYVPSRIAESYDGWRLPGASPEDPPIHLGLDETGTCLLFRTKVGIVSESHATPALFRFLLSLNDATSGPLRFSIEGRVIYLSQTEPTESALEHDLSSLLRKLAASAVHYGHVLERTHGVHPPSND